MTAYYYVLMALILGLAYPLCIRRPSAKKNILYVSIVFIYMFMMSAFRYGIGNDYFHYRSYFYGMTDGNMPVKDVMNGYGLELGYVLLMKLVALAGGEYIHLNIMTALLTLVPAAYVICRYSKMPWISSWLYLTITFFYNSMNFTRQTIAATIIFLGYRYFTEKKHLAVLLFIIAGSLFHSSVLIMIPIYLISLIKPSAKSLGIIGGGGVLTFIFSRQIISIVLTNFLPRYAKYADSIYVTVGLTPKFLIIPAILAAIIITAYFMGMKNKSERAAIQTNFIFYNFLIWLFIVKHFIIERFTLPIYIYTLISLPDALIFFKEYAEEKNAAKKNAGKRSRREKNKKAAVRLRAVFPAVTCLVIVSTYIYNDFCAGQRVHGVFPYQSVFDPAGGVTDKDLVTRPREMYVNSSFLSFLNLAGRRDCTIVLCVKGSVNGKLELPYRMYLKHLGFETDLTALDGSSYIGVVNGGKAIFERTGNETLMETMSFYDGKYNITAVSGGSEYGDIASLTIFGKEFMPNENGLNFAVFDNELKRIVTAQSYDISGYDCFYGHSYAFNGIEYMPEFEEDFKNGV